MVVIPAGFFESTHANADHMVWRPNGEWWACERPEAPVDDVKTFYDLTCRGCVLKLGSTVIQEDSPVYEGCSGTSLSSREVYEELRGRFGLPPLPIREMAP